MEPFDPYYVGVSYGIENCDVNDAISAVCGLLGRTMSPDEQRLFVVGLHDGYEDSESYDVGMMVVPTVVVEAIPF